MLTEIGEIDSRSHWLQRLKLYRSQKESEIGQMARYVEV